MYARPIELTDDIKYLHEAKAALAALEGSALNWPTKRI